MKCLSFAVKSLLFPMALPPRLCQLHLPNVPHGFSNSKAVFLSTYVSFKYRQEWDKMSYILWRRLKNVYHCRGKNGTCQRPRQFHSPLLLAGSIAIHSFRMVSVDLSLPVFQPLKLLIEPRHTSALFQRFTEHSHSLSSYLNADTSLLLIYTLRTWTVPSDDPCPEVTDILWRRAIHSWVHLTLMESEGRFHSCINYLLVDGAAAAAGSVVAEAALGTKHRSFTYTVLVGKDAKMHFVIWSNREREN